MTAPAAGLRRKKGLEPKTELRRGSGLRQVSEKRRAALAAAGLTAFSTFSAPTAGIKRTKEMPRPRAAKPARTEKPPLPPKLSVPKPAKRPIDTGPTTATRRKVKARDKRCVRCGRDVLNSGIAYSLQHILGRGAGGTLDPLDIAIGMVIGVRDDGPAAIYKAGAQLPTDVLLDMMVRLAEMVPDTKRLSDLLAWKTEGRRQRRMLARPKVHTDLGACPSPAAYARHVANGEPVDEPCEAMHRRYERGFTLRRAA